MTYFMAHYTLIIKESVMMVFRAFYESNSIMSIIFVLVPHIIVIIMFGR